MTDEFRTWARDTGERALFTFIEAFVGLMLVSSSDLVDGLNASTLEAAFLSAVISALAVVKGAVAKRRDGISPASFMRD